MKWTGDNLKSAARKVLKDRGYEKECLALDDLADEIAETNHNLLRKIQFYKWPGLVLLVLIPVISTSLSFSITKNSPQYHVYVEAVSYALTLLTLMNSIFAPRERFTSLCQMGIPLHEISVGLLAELESLPDPIQERHLHEVVTKFEKSLLPYKKGLINMFLPQTDVGAATKTRAKPEILQTGGKGKKRHQRKQKAMKQAA